MYVNSMDTDPRGDINNGVVRIMVARSKQATQKSMENPRVVSGLGRTAGILGWGGRKSGWW